MLDCAVTEFIRGYNPIWSFVDLQGLQADDTFWLYVLTNTIPYVPAPVYQDPSGTIPWGFPIQFLANGTLPDNIYFANNTFYRLEIRKNLIPPPTQLDQLIYLIENYNPSSTTTTPIGTTSSTVDNQVSNSQFSVVNFSGSFNLVGATNPPSIEVAPGWFLDLTGTGNATLTVVPLNNALSNPSNAPYALHIEITGWTQAVLKQRLQQNGMNWANQNVASSFTARTVSGAPILTARLDASNGAPLALLSVDTLTNSFVEYPGQATLGASPNPDLPPNAYIDFKIIMPGTSDIFITSLQVVTTETLQNVSYQQDTIERQLDHLAHYYKPLLAYKPIPSYLVGWDFPLNPAQILGNTVPIFAGVNQAQYFWDQTIVYQTATNNVDGARAANGGLTLTSHGAGQIALVQYLDQTTARKILSDRASVHMSISASTALAGVVSLWATTDANLPTLPNAFITALDANGLPTAFNSVNWVQVPNLYQNNRFTAQLASATNSEANDINLNGWDMQNAVPTNTATYFAIVVGFAAWANGNTITFNSIGLCPGDIATRPAPKTLDQTLRDCERYYEKSYIPADIPGTAVTTFNSLSASMNSTVPFGGAFQCFILESPFTIEYRTQKRIPTTQGFPTVTIYPTSAATVGNVSIYTVIAAVVALNGLDPITVWGNAFIGDKFATFTPTTNNAARQANGFNATTPVLFYARYHYVADARLGIVN